MKAFFLAITLIILPTPSSFAADPITIRVSPETQYQTMVGFGGALTWYSDWIYNGSKAAEINQLIFEDCGINILRLRNTYYPDGYPSSKTNTDTTNLTHVTAARAANPDIEVLLSSWSPPVNLKSDGTLGNGGTLTKDDNGNYRYAELGQYWVDCLDNIGWTPDYLSFQNEPGYVNEWDTAEFAATETDSMASYALAADAVWDAIKDRPDAPKMIGSEAQALDLFFEQSSQLRSRSYIKAYAYHIYDFYDGNIDSEWGKERLKRVHDDFGDRPNWMTEFSSEEYNWIDTAVAMHNTVTIANASAYIYWALVWDAATPDSAIKMNWDGTYTVGPHFYTLKHYAKHVEKGSQRINVLGPTESVKVSAYLSPDQTHITLVAINNGTAAEQIVLSQNISINALSGYQSVADSYYQTMTGLDATQPITLPSQSLTTLVFAFAEVDSSWTTVLSEDFETSTPGSSTPPAGWSLITMAGAPTFATTATGQGSQGDGTSAGLAGKVSSTDWLDNTLKNLPGAYLVKNTDYDLTDELRISFDFQIINEGEWDDIVFLLGAIDDGVSTDSDGESLTVGLRENGGTSITTGLGTDLASITYNLADDTWYHATATWLPWAGATGTLTLTVNNFTSDAFTLDTTNFTFDSVIGQIGFGSYNDTIRFDNITVETGEVVTLASPDFAVTAFNMISSPNKEITLSWSSASGQSYRVVYSLELTNWSNTLSSGIVPDAGANTTRTFDLAAAGLAAESQVFFRVEQE